MIKKGHRRKNWTERWFVLKPNIISYYVSEDLKDKKGDILLDENCCVEVRVNGYLFPVLPPAVQVVYLPSSRLWSLKIILKVTFLKQYRHTITIVSEPKNYRYLTKFIFSKKKKFFF